MDREQKYIIDSIGNFMIFSKSISHDKAARAMHMEIVGAGFCNIAVGYKSDGKLDSDDIGVVSVHCYGKSISLGIESRPEDEDIINANINEGINF